MILYVDLTGNSELLRRFVLRVGIFSRWKHTCTSYSFEKSYIYLCRILCARSNTLVYSLYALLFPNKQKEDLPECAERNIRSTMPGDFKGTVFQKNQIWKINCLRKKQLQYNFNLLLSSNKNSSLCEYGEYAKKKE
jgi:hypothetical protein